MIIMKKGIPQSSYQNALILLYDSTTFLLQKQHFFVSILPCLNPQTLFPSKYLSFKLRALLPVHTENTADIIA